MLVASVLSAEMRLESTRCVVPRTALPAPLQRVSASGLQCLVIASGERSCASVRKESVNVVVREAEGRGVICVIVDDAEKLLASLAHETKGLHAHSMEVVAERFALLTILCVLVLFSAGRHGALRAC